MDAAPAAIIAIYGALWIALHAGGGRGSAHALWQSLALAETVLALFLRGRKPAGALAGILAAYLLFGLDPLLLPAVVFALFTVAAIRDPQTVAVAGIATTAALVTMPYIHGEALSFTGYSLPRLAAAGAAVAVGTYLRVRRHRRAATPRQASAVKHRRWAQLASARGRAGPPGVHGRFWSGPGHATTGPARQAPISPVPVPTAGQTEPE